MNRTSAALLITFASVALAQVPPPPGGNRPKPLQPKAQPAKPPPAQPQPIANNAEPTQTIKPKHTCEEQRKVGRYNIYFDKVEIEKLVQTVSDVTCRTFILPENVRGKISIIGPENGKYEVNADQFYAAFLAALDANSLAVYEQGKFMKIVDKQRAKQFPIPTITDEQQPYTLNEQMVTRIFKVKNVEIEQLRGVLQQLVSPSGDTIPFQPDTIIVNDLGSNMHRLEKVIDQLDTRAASDEIRVIQVQYATAQDVADKITKLFESKGNKPGQRPNTIVPAPNVPRAPAPNQPAVNNQPVSSGGAASLSQIIPDERTNKLIIVASPAGFERIENLVKEIDIPISGEGRINVYYLENANAEDVASTLQTLAQGTANRPKTGGPPAPNAPKPGGGAAELFAGEVKVSADKATNSLVIIASQADFRSLVRVVEKLDIRRRQVFVEAVIMEVNLDRNSDLGINLHAGFPVTDAAGNTLPVLFGTKYSSGSGLPPSLNIANLVSMSGFLAGFQGPTVPNLTIAGIQIPAFGVVINALQKSSDVNVLSTPHILTTDNEEAEITVGQNVPFQSGFSTGGLGLSSLAGLGGASGLSSSLGGLGSSLGGLSGLGGIGGTPFGTIQRQNVDLKLSIKPQINDSDYVRLVINEQIEEIASQDAVLGPTTSKRSAKTTIVAKDQETVVIGGIMQDRIVESVSKTPILGDIPLLGNLFRQQTRRKVKTNLLLFLTPYIIRDGSDFRRIFERKMRERQEFVEQFYGATTGYDVAIDFDRKSGPLARLQQIVVKETNKIENGGPGNGSEKLITPTGNATPPTDGENSTTEPVPAKEPAPELVPPPPAEAPAPTPEPAVE